VPRWEEVAVRPPAVVVPDVMMPDLDGVSVVRRMRADGVDVPVCILSARDEVDDRVAGLQAGADDYLVKPFALAELNALLRRRGSDAARGEPRMPHTVRGVGWVMRA
jgi:DNA-binding response OmpR family regulator